MAIFAVSYAYDPRLAEQDAVRPEHRAFLGGLFAAKVVLASGPVRAGDARGALILLRADSPAAALRILEADPFFVHGFVAERAASEFTPVYAPADWTA